MSRHYLDWKSVLVALWVATLAYQPRPTHEVEAVRPRVSVEVVRHSDADGHRRQALVDLRRGDAFAALAASELAATQDPTALPYLEAHAFRAPRDLHDEIVRDAAIAALGCYEDSAARATLRELAVTADPGGRRYAAVRALRNQLRPEDLPALRQALELGLASDDILLVDEATAALLDLGVDPADDQAGAQAA